MNYTPIPAKYITETFECIGYIGPQKGPKIGPKVSKTAKMLNSGPFMSTYTPGTDIKGAKYYSTTCQYLVGTSGKHLDAL